MQKMTMEATITSTDMIATYLAPKEDPGSSNNNQIDLRRSFSGRGFSSSFPA